MKEQTKSGTTLLRTQRAFDQVSQHRWGLILLHVPTVADPSTPQLQVDIGRGGRSQHWCCCQPSDSRVYTECRPPPMSLHPH